MNEEVLNELKKLNKLLSLIFLKDMGNTDKIIFLNQAGFLPKEIAETIGTTPNTVSATLSRIKNKTKK